MDTLAAPIDPETFVVGEPEEWKQFAISHREFLRSAQHLFDTGDLLFNRTFAPASPADHVVFGLSLLCFEDFREIYTLAGNGLGFGAAKILRGMFERLVTVTYIQKNPKLASRFVSFEHIRRYKLAQPLWEANGEEFISKSEFDAAKAERDRVAPDFVQQCKTSGCDKTFPSGSWTDLDFVSMTRAAGEHLFRELPAAYRLPMGETHPSYSAVVARMTETSTGATFQNSQQNAKSFVPTILVQAHSALINSYNVHLEQFPAIRPTAQAAVDRCGEEFLEVWKTRPEI